MTRVSSGALWHCWVDHTLIFSLASFLYRRVENMKKNEGSGEDRGRERRGLIPGIF